MADEIINIEVTILLAADERLQTHAISRT